MDGDRLACFIIDELKLWLTDKNRHAIADLEHGLSTTPDHLLWRNTIDLLHLRPHEVDAAR